MCIDNSDYIVSLDLHKVYRVLSDKQAAEDDCLRVIDNSGEDYIYASERFVPVELPHRAKKSFSREIPQSTVVASTRTHRLSRRASKGYDPILEELHRVKDAIAKAHDYDVDKLFDCMRARRGKPPAEPCPHMPKRPKRGRKDS